MASSSKPAKPPTQADVDKAVAKANAAVAEDLADADGRIERDRRAELDRQQAVVDAVAEHNSRRADPDATGRVSIEGLNERSGTWRSTEAVSSVRVSSPERREIAGTAVPYGAVALSTDIGPETFAPGAFRESVAHWMARDDGGRMPFRPKHGEAAIGTVSELRDTPDGVQFVARIREGERGDAYLRDVADGLNGVSIEFGPGGPGGSRRGRDGTTVHSAARLHAIAGSDVPAYDSARVSLRDMEGPVNCEHCDAELVPGVGHDCPKAPAADAATAPAADAPADAGAGERDASTITVTLDQRTRSALESASVRGIRPQIRITRPDAVYTPTGEHQFLRDSWLSHLGDSEARERQERHRRHLADVAVQMEREAASRYLTTDTHQRAGDVLSSEIPGAYPNDYLPGLLTPRILKGRPMGGFYQRVPIADARPRIFPKVTTSTTVAVQSAEGAALSATDFATTAVTATPLIYGAYTDVSRQTIDGADPAAQAMILADLLEAYSQASEAVIKTAVEAGSTASGTAITAATPYAGVLANVVTYYGTRFVPAAGAFIPSALYSVLLAQGDTTGRPFLPMLGPTNSDGSVDRGAVAADVLGAATTLSWASTVNVCVFGVPSDFVIYESAVAQFSYDQIVGPQAVRIGIWAYLVVGTRLGSLKVTAA